MGGMLGYVGFRMYLDLPNIHVMIAANLKIMRTQAMLMGRYVEDPGRD